MLDPKLKILTFDEMIKAGLMPWESNTHDINKLLEGFSPEESRKMRRKFRKIWRKELKRREEENAKRNTMGRDDKKRLGLGATKPTKEQRKARRSMIKDVFMETARKRAIKLKNEGTDD